MDTTSTAVIDAFEASLTAYDVTEQRSLDDRFAAVWGDDFRALESRDRMRAFITLVVVAPKWSGGSRCRKLLQLMVGIRYPVTKAGRARMLEDLEGLVDYVRGLSNTIPGLYGATPGDVLVRYGAFPGTNTALVLMPVTLDYHVAV